MKNLRNLNASMVLGVICIGAAILLAPGCAYMHSTTSRTISTSGVTNEVTHATAYALFDANAELVKFRNSSGTPHGGGTSIASFDGSATSTNLTQIISAVVSAAITAAK